MRDAVAKGVETSASRMFHEGAESVTSQLQHLLQQVESILRTETNQISDLIRRDYHNIFEKSQSAQDAALREEISTLLQKFKLLTE
jgi:DNA anti-recombination protein RmuC